MREFVYDGPGPPHVPSRLRCTQSPHTPRYDAQKENFSGDPIGLNNDPDKVFSVVSVTSSEDQAKGFESSADVYMPKPFSLQVLKAQVKHSLSYFTHSLKDQYGKAFGIHGRNKKQLSLQNVFSLREPPAMLTTLSTDFVSK